MKSIVLALACLIFMSTAEAGTACSEITPSADTMRKAFQLAITTRNALDQSGAQVALVARVGQDLSKYHLRYSHMAFLWRDHPQGKWMAIHELNHCGTSVSALYNEGLANFFFDDMFAWDALILIPSPALQEKIVLQLRNPQTLSKRHVPEYNMVAYPFSTRYQNSNQWVLEVLAATMSEDSLANREKIQAWLRENGYQPSTLKIPALQRLGGRIFRANVSFDDHPTSERMHGNIQVVSVDSVATFVMKKDPLARSQELHLQ